MEIVGRVSGRCLRGVLRVSGRCLEGVWRVYMGCLNGNLVILDWCYQDRSRYSRSSQDRSSQGRSSQDRSYYPGTVCPRYVPRFFCLGWVTNILTKHHVERRG